MKKFFSVVLALAMAWATFGVPAEETTTSHIGVIGPGPALPPSGLAGPRGAEIAVEEIDAAGKVTSSWMWTMKTTLKSPSTLQTRDTENKGGR